MNKRLVDEVYEDELVKLERKLADLKALITDPKISQIKRYDRVRLLTPLEFDSYTVDGKETVVYPVGAEVLIVGIRKGTTAKTAHFSVSQLSGRCINKTIRAKDFELI